MNLATLVIALLAIYVAAFVVLVALGRNRAFDGMVAFRYAGGDGMNRALGMLFRPLYLLGRSFGLRLAGPPFRSLR